MTCKKLMVKKKSSNKNTLQFVQGLPANNVLLTGARGTGKSSLIKACLNAYAAQGLRLIEVDKARPGRPARHCGCGGRAARKNSSSFVMT
jgi:predicted GTPase